MRIVKKEVFGMLKEEKASLYLVAIVGVVAIVGLLVLILNSNKEVSLSNDYSFSEADLTGQATKKVKINEKKPREKLTDEEQTVDDGSSGGSSSSSSCVENEGEDCSYIDCGITNSRGSVRGWQACTYSCSGACVCPTCS